MVEVGKLIDMAIENIGQGGTMHAHLDLPIKTKIAVGFADGRLEVLIANFGNQIHPEKVTKITGLEKSIKNGRIGVNDPMTEHFALTCNTEVSKNCFKIFLREFVERSITSGCTTEVINQCIHDFQEFFSRNQFNQNQEMGLYAELLVLREMLDKVDHAIVINSWAGPDLYKYDFLLPDKVIEVKSTASNQPQISINGSEQFKSQKNLRLILLNLQRGNENPVNGIIDEISSRLKDSSLDLMFRNKLLKTTGQSDPKLAEYSVREIRIYKVNSDFPSLPNLRDANEFLSRLTKVNYTVRLDGVDCQILQKMEQIKNEF